MSHLLINTTRVSYPWTRDITLPSVDISGFVEMISAKTKRFFEGSLMSDFWTVFAAGI